MRWPNLGQVVLVVSLLGLTLAGCKRSQPTKTETVIPSPSPGVAVQGAIPAVDRVVLTNDLRQIGTLYRNYINENNRPPTKTEDLEKPGSKLHKAMSEGTYFVYWDVNLDQLQDNKAKTLLAYSRGTPDKGGMALMADCQTVVPMRPDEYKAALKPPGR